MIEKLKNRQDAGAKLAARLSHYEGRDDVIVLAVPTGAVAVAGELARALGCRLDIFITRKIAFPGHPEVALGIVSETGKIMKNRHLLSTYHVTEEYVSQEVGRQMEEIQWKIALYRGRRRLPSLEGKTVILVDEGVESGNILKSTILALSREKLARLVVAVAAAPRDTEREIRKVVDEMVCLESPDDFITVKGRYAYFPMVGDEDILDTLCASRKPWKQETAPPFNNPGEGHTS